MDDKITTDKLFRCGFTWVEQAIKEFGGYFEKGKLQISPVGDVVVAYRYYHNNLMELGPVTTMDQVQMLDSVINPAPQDTITVDAMHDLGWVNDGFRRFFRLNFGIDMQDESATVFPLYSTAGLTRIHLGYVTTMSEVKSLTEIATRRI